MNNIDMAGGDAAQPLGIPGVRLPELVLGRARGRGAKPALIEADSGREISYEGLGDAVGDAAAWLVGVGVRRGRGGAVRAEHIEYVIAWYAASSAGAVLTTVNPVLTAEELGRHLRRTDTR
jgi:acyl-CoA synthetase (AMP-forming)/AMP-acid ligase II